MVTFYHKVQLVRDIFVMPTSYSHKPKTNGTHCICIGLGVSPQDQTIKTQGNCTMFVSHNSYKCFYCKLLTAVNNVSTILSQEFKKKCCLFKVKKSYCHFTPFSYKNMLFVRSFWWFLLPFLDSCHKYACSNSNFTITNCRNREKLGKRRKTRTKSMFLYEKGVK